MFEKTNKPTSVAKNKMAQVEFIGLALLAFSGLGAYGLDCPCSVSDSRLTCEDNSIVNFPEDLNAAGCNIDVGEVQFLRVTNQQIKNLPANAFAGFSSLLEINMHDNEITSIDKDAFKGLQYLSLINLDFNNLTNFDGALDSLIRLTKVSFRDNLYLKSYTTEEWYFCSIAQTQELFSGTDIVVYKDLKKSKNTADYCASVSSTNIDSPCQMVDNVFDCSAVLDFKDAACFIPEKNFTNILFTYPADPTPAPVQDFHEGATNEFFQNFNTQNGSIAHFKFVDEFTLYFSKFDLSQLPLYTSERTTQVTVKADTIYLTSPITVNYKLNLMGRIVSLSEPITMNMSRTAFLDMEERDAWAQKEELYTVGRVVMDRKQFGLVTVLRDSLLKPITWEASEGNPSFCKPKDINVTETGTYIEDWYDSTTVNLLYVCAKTLIDTNRNRNDDTTALVKDISSFMLDFVYNKTMVNNQQTFLAAQKFKRLLDLVSAGRNAHNIPNYSVSTITTLASVMSDRMSQYRVNEIEQENQLFIASGRMNDMKINFEMIEQQQKLYFEKEQAQLEMIWAAEDNEWEFDFSHRNSIADQINGGLDFIADEMYEMQINDLENALREATNSVDHINDVVAEYEGKVERLVQQTNGSLSVQNELLSRLDTQVNHMNDELAKFEVSVNDYITVQETRAVMGVFKAIFTVGISLVEGKFDDAIGDFYDAIFDIEELINTLKVLVNTCNGFRATMDALLAMIDDLTDINVNIGTEFKDALQNAIELKLESGAFDEIERQADIKIRAMGDGTGYAISGTDDVMVALTSVADTGHQLVNEASEFANIVMQLSDRQDELDVARSDRDRAVADVKNIQDMLENMIEARKDFEANRNQSREDYENELKAMEAEYKNMTAEMREEYKERITALYESYMTTFSSIATNYNNEMNKMMASINRKFYGLREHSMNQRSMVMALYSDFCDANYFHAFESCGQSNKIDVPSMSDNFEALMEKLSGIIWSGITSDENLPGPVRPFTSRFTIHSGRNDSFIIENLRKNHQVDINLLSYTQSDYERFWRTRIETIEMILLDKSGYPIQSIGIEQDEWIGVQVDFPNVFYDKDSLGHEQLFSGQSWNCFADYWSHGDIEGLEKYMALFLVFIKIPLPIYYI